MKRTRRKFADLLAHCLLAGCVGSFAACAQTELPDAQKKALRYPLLCAGIDVGRSKDSDAQRLYGKGYFVADEDHLGGRYYVDLRHHVTLHVEIGPDRIIDVVEYQQGLHLPGKPSARVLAQATSAQLASDKPMQSGITFGVSAQRVLKKYGKPKNDTQSKGTRIIRYETDYTVTRDVLYYAAEFHFQKNRLVYVRLEEGE